MPADDLPGAPPAALLSHGAWTRRFGASPRALGQRLTLNGQTDFPSEADRLLLTVGANQAAAVLQRQRAEGALRESEHRWRSLTEALPQLVWTAAPDGA